MLFYRVACTIIRWVLLPAQMRLRVSGAERCPRSGALIIVGNHLGLIDPLVIAAHTPRTMRILAKSDIFHWPIVGWLARWSRIVPVRRGESDRVAMRTLAGVLTQGHCIQLMPEGTYPKVPLPPAMLQAKAGAAFLALHAHAQVLPVAITGTERIWAPSRGWRLWLRPRVTLTYGEPYYPEAPANLPARLAYQAVADDMGRRIAAMLPPAYRGYYASAVVPEAAGAAQPPNIAPTDGGSDAGLPHTQGAGQDVRVEG